MDTFSPFLCVERPSHETLDWLKQRLSRLGLQSLQTFDLDDARLGVPNCPCPHHGTSQCDCQMIVLLVYGGRAEPATLILHGNAGQTWLSLVDTPLQPLDPGLQSAIQQALHVGTAEQDYH